MVQSSKPPQLLYTVEAAAAQLCIGRTVMYSLIKSGAIESVCIGRSRRVPAEALADFIAILRNKDCA